MGNIEPWWTKIGYAIDAGEGDGYPGHDAYEALENLCAEVESLRQQHRGAVEVVRTLRAYIGSPEGDGPIRYTQALELCDSILHSHGGSNGET